MIVLLGLVLGWDADRARTMLRSTGLQMTTGGAEPLHGPVRLMSHPDIVLEQTSIEPPVRSEGTSPPRALARRIVLDKPVLSVHTTRRTVPDLDGLEAGDLAPIVERLAALDFDEIAIRGGTIRFPIAGSDAETLSEVDADISFSRKGIVSLRADATYRGERLKITGGATAAGDRVHAGRLPIQLTVKSRLLNARLEGMAAVNRGLQLSGRADLAILKLREVARWLGAQVPLASTFENARIRGKLEWSGATMSFSEATIAVDGNEGTGTLAASFSRGRPTIEGTLAFKKLDLQPYLAAAMASRLMLAPVLAETASRQPTLLRALDADLRISADAVVVPGLLTGRGAVAIALKKGRLLADVAELELEKGTFEGQVEIHDDVSPPRYAMRGKLGGVDAGRVLSHWLDRNPLQGRADIRLDLAGSGDSLQHVINELSGKADLKLIEVGKLGLDLRGLLQSAKRSDTRGWPSASGASTGLETLEALVHLQKGTVLADSLQARSGTLAIDGTGTIDLAKREMDLTLTMGANPQTHGPASGGEAVVLRGPWRNPKIWFEPTQPAGSGRLPQ